MIPQHHPAIQVLEEKEKRIYSVIRMIEISPNVLEGQRTYKIVYSDQRDESDFYNEVIFKSGNFYLCFFGNRGSYFMDMYFPPEEEAQAKMIIKGLKKKKI
jgi:hypothetical protein